MVSATPLLLVLSWITMLAAAEVCRGTHCDPRPCNGAHCPPGSRSSRTSVHPTVTHASTSQHRARTAPESHPRARGVPPSRCPEGGCGGATAATSLLQPANGTRDCRGIECRLPLRIRAKPRAKPCVGEECVESVQSAAGQSAPVHLYDRAAQFLGDFPELGYPPTPPELGVAPLGVQLTCDIKPGMFSFLSFSLFLSFVYVRFYTFPLQTLTII